MSRGITPVIAIILLLLMAVAAAGGFYFVYQGFTESGEESGATQIESLGEQSLAAIQIESAAGGRLYVRNVGATDIDLSKSTVYVENQPVEVNRSADTLAEKNRAVLKLIELPGCTAEKCEVKISGAASTSKKIDLAKLLCSSDSDCYAGETCSGGICAGGETDCGNGVCDPGETSSSCPADCYCGDDVCSDDENGLSCFEDCRPLLFPLHEFDPAEGDADIYQFDWNGTTYVKGENVTNNTISDLVTTFFLHGGEAMALGVTDFMGGSTQEIFYARHDGSWTVDNITDNDWKDFDHKVSADYNSTGDVMAAWITGEESDKEVAWASFDGTDWSPVHNHTDFNNTGMPDIAFAPDDSALLVWASTAPGYAAKWVNYSLWDGSSWTESGSITSATSEVDWFGGTLVDFDSEGNAVAAWVANYPVSGAEKVIQYSLWDGSSWGQVENVSDSFEELFTTDIVFDANDQCVLISKMEPPDDPKWLRYSLWDGSSWSALSNLTAQDFVGDGGPLHDDKGNLVVIAGASGSYMSYTHWDGSSWADYVEMEITG